jgi:hypothetical protein
LGGAGGAARKVTLQKDALHERNLKTFQPTPAIRSHSLLDIYLYHDKTM